MTSTIELSEIVLLDSAIHNRSTFSCGDETYDRYLKTIAKQDVTKGLAACWVLTCYGSNDVIGYYTLSSCSLQYPDEQHKKITRYPKIPATLIGRLAASNKPEHTGQRLGEHLLLDALSRSLDYSRKIGSRVVVVDSEESAIEFYKKYNFVQLEDPGTRLIIEMAQIQKLF